MHANACYAHWLAGFDAQTFMTGIVAYQGRTVKDWLVASGMRVGDQVQLKADAGGGLLIRRVEGPAGALPASCEVGYMHAFKHPALASWELWLHNSGDATCCMTACSKPANLEEAAMYAAAR